MMGSPVQRVASLVQQQNFLKFLCLFGIGFGALVRLVEYVSNRSLWGDEAMLVLNLVERSYLELLQPLDYNQAAPPGFLWIEKLAIQLFGNNEYALRLFPFLAGLVSLWAFYKLATRYTSAVAAPIAIILFSCLKYTLYYATEVKQYSSDVMVALVLCLLLIPLRHQPLSPKQILFLGGLGAIFIWISHPTVFVLAGIEIGYFVIATNKQRLAIVMNRFPMYLSWLVSFAALYFLTIQNTLNNDTLTSSWGERYPNSIVDILWLFDAFGRFFYNPLGFLDITDGIALVVFVIGFVAFYRRDRITLLAITAPFAITILATYLEKYPFRERLVLFLAPLAILIIAEGIAVFITQWQGRSQPFKTIVLALGAFVVSTLLIFPLFRASQLLVHPTQVEELRPVLAYIQSHQQANDTVFVYVAGEPQFLYYAPRFGYTPNDYVMGKQAMAEGGRRNRELTEGGVKRFRREVLRLKGNDRVWFVFCATSDMEEQTFLDLIQPIGQQLDAFRQTGAFTYLYDLKP